MWSPTLLFDRRAYGPDKLSSVTQKDFCNTICQERKSRVIQSPCRPVIVPLIREDQPFAKG